MAPSSHARPRRRTLLAALALLLAAAAVVLPAIASSETASVQAQGSAFPFRWSPGQASVRTGAALTFANPSASIDHGVHWNSGPGLPRCSGVPGASAGQPSFGQSWSGSCTFAKPGVYTYYCTVHGPAMSGSVIVNAAGQATTTTSAGNLSLLAGASPARSLQLPASQRGQTVRGTLKVSPAGEQARVVIELLARAGVLGGRGQGQAGAGRLVLAHLQARALSFAVKLDARARQALRRHASLALSVSLVLSAARTGSLTLTQPVVLRA